MSLYESFILAVVEGLTEYLPISSTGHLILTSSLMGIEENDFVKNYTVIVQFGAVMSVVAFYWRRFVVSVDLYKKLLVAFLPAAVVGLAVKNYIDAILGDVHVVAWSLILGGVFLGRLLNLADCSSIIFQPVSRLLSMPDTPST